MKKLETSVSARCRPHRGTLLSDLWKPPVEFWAKQKLNRLKWAISYTEPQWSPMRLSKAKPLGRVLSPQVASAICLKSRARPVHRFTTCSLKSPGRWYRATSALVCRSVWMRGERFSSLSMKKPSPPRRANCAGRAWNRSRSAYFTPTPILFMSSESARF